jgi:hypothetical protein
MIWLLGFIPTWKLALSAFMASCKPVLCEQQLVPKQVALDRRV